MTHFSTDQMAVRATERYAYGWQDKRAFDVTKTNPLANLRILGQIIFRTDAIARGWCPSSYAKGNSAAGIIGSMDGDRL